MQISSTKRSTYSSRLLKALYIILALIPWGLVLLASPRGFDLSDESFYLLNFVHPEDITSTFSMFGVILKPLYDVVGGNIPALRVLGALILLMVSAVVAWMTLGFIAGQPTPDISDTFSKERRFILTLFLSAGSVLYYSLWLVTPSYNWLTLVGLTLFWGGFLLWLKSKRHHWTAHLGAALFAFAAALVFWAKPTTGALLLLYPLAALALNRNQWWRLLSFQTLIYGIAGFALGMSIPLLYGISPQGIVNMMMQGVEHQNIMKPGLYDNGLDMVVQGSRQTMSLFTNNSYPTLFLALWLIPLLTVALIARFSKDHTYRWSRILLAVGLIVNILTVTVVMSDDIGHWSLNIVLLTVVYLTAGNYAQNRLAGSVVRRKRGQTSLWMIPIFSLIFIYVFGTGNNYAFQSGMAAYFYLLAVSVLFLTVKEGTINAFLMRVGVPTLLIAIIGLTYISSLSPYRQDQPIWQMDQSVSVHGDSNTVIVSEEMARHITEFQVLADTAGWETGTPFIDLTGTSPGAAYALAGRTYGFPWLLGDYPGSDAATVYILRQWRQDHLETAWILTATQDSTVDISLSVLAEVGLDFPNDYVRVGTVRLPTGNVTQTLWRPLN